MEGMQKAFRTVSRDGKLCLPSSSSSSPSSSGEGGGAAAAALTANQSGVLVARPPRQAVSLWTCSKLCAICFVAGVVVGFTLKRRVRIWASKLLKRIKDD